MSINDDLTIEVIGKHNGVMFAKKVIVPCVSQKTHDEILSEVSSGLRRCAIMISAPFQPDPQDRWSTKYGDKK